MHLLVGDGHFVGAKNEAKDFGALLDAADRKSGLREISILGDLFELWIGLAGLEQPYENEVMQHLRRFSARGVRLRYVVGNKDFFVSEWNERHQVFGEVVARSTVVDSPLGRLRLAHGDLVNKDDHPYRLWRWISRSWFVSGVMKSLPRRWLRRLAVGVAERMKATNRYHKSYFPEHHLRADALDPSLEPGIALHCYGHFHVYRELDVRIDKASTRVVTLPFLGGECAGLLLTKDGLQRIGVNPSPRS